MKNQNKEWKLRGTAYGRVYSGTMTLIEKKMVPLPDDIIEGHMSVVTEAERNDPEYRKMVSMQEQAVFQTNKGDSVIVSPRYVGSRLGSNDDGRGNTICAFHFNGGYVALADYNEQNQEIVVVEY